MKKSLKIIVMFIGVILIAGCMDAKVKIGVNSDKSVDVSMSMQLDMVKYMQIMFETMGTPKNESEIKEYLKENSDELNTDEFFSEEDKKKLEEAGYKVNVNMDNENYVYKVDISQHFANIDTISTSEEITTNFEDIFDGEKDVKFFTKTSNGTYKANLVVNTEETTDENQEISMEEMEQYITYDFEVTLPDKAISNNADKVSSDNKTLTWNLMNKDSYNFEFAFPKKATKTAGSSSTIDSNDILAYGLIGGGILVLIITIIIFTKKKKSA